MQRFDRATTWAAVAIGIDGVLAIALGLGHYLWADPASRHAGGALASVVFGGVLALPGAVALIGLRRRPMLLIAAGAMLLPLSVLSFALVTLPLVVPAFLAMAAGTRLDRRLGGPAGRELLAGACVVVFGLAALVSLYATDDPATRTTPTSSTSTSDYITTREALTGAGFLAAALVAPLLVAPRPPNHPRLSRPVPATGA